MGFFSKIWNKTKDFFGKVGKTIKKVFKKVGKFTNKLGIVGQIGMMIAMPYMASWALGNLATFGTKFMTGLTGVAEGGGFWAGAAEVTKSVLTTVGKVARTGKRMYDTVSGAVKGLIGDAAAGIGKTLGLSPANTNDTLYNASQFLGGPQMSAPTSFTPTLDPYAIPGKEMPASVYKIPGPDVKVTPLGEDDATMLRKSLPEYDPITESTDASFMSSGRPVYAPEPEVYASESETSLLSQEAKEALRESTETAMAKAGMDAVTAAGMEEPQVPEVQLSRAYPEFSYGGTQRIQDTRQDLVERGQLASLPAPLGTLSPFAGISSNFVEESSNNAINLGGSYANAMAAYDEFTKGNTDAPFPSWATSFA